MPGLSDFLQARLTTDKVLHESDPHTAPWWEEGVSIEVDEDTYLEHLDLLPPRYMNGALFAFGEGVGSFTIFWREHGKHYAHHLSQADTERFCDLAGVPYLQ